MADFSRGTALRCGLCFRTAGNDCIFGRPAAIFNRGTGKALVDFLEREIYPGTSLSLTTFRRGDRADAGWRAVWVRLGFAEAELLEEYGYPTQRFVRESGRSRP